MTKTILIYPILPAGAPSPIDFAAQELRKYLQAITALPVDILPQASYSAGLPAGIWLGVGSDLPQADVPTVTSDLDDAIAVAVRGGQGWIAGANPRSVLLAVYRFLYQNGCRWPRPTPESELIPHRALSDLTASLNEKAAFRHRAICIEGAVSLEHVLAIVDWAPKMGFSGYFTQFREGHTFFDRWYSHRLNPLVAPEGCTVEQARQYTRAIEAELAKRGLVYHAIGHGWTCEAFGIPGLGWDPVVQDWPQEVLDALALVNGKRAMWHDIPLITSLCFSNPQVRRKVVDCVITYLETHRNIQALHFWLDDGFNNKCECEACSQMRPSDFYIRLLNELDEALTARGYPEKVVFLAYADLLWPPEVERLNNPDRFILMFAPITRSYRRPLYPTHLDYTPPPYVRNRLVFSNNNDEQLAFLRGWQQQFKGDSFIFEYHMIQAGAYFNDPDGMHMARLLYDDIRNLPTLGLNGYVSCQFLRNFFPTGLAMFVMGRALWDGQVAYEDLERDYFDSAFGPEGEACRQYLLEMAKLQDIVPLRAKEPCPEAIPTLQAAQEALNSFAPVIERNLALPQPAQARSWQILQWHARLLAIYLRLLLARAAGDFATAGLAWEEMKTLAWQMEPDLQTVFDVHGFVMAYNSLLAD